MTLASVAARFQTSPVKKESILLLAICMIDLVSTVVLVQLGVAKEANPILAWYLGQGIGMFVAAKTFLSFMPVMGLEIVGWKYPKLAVAGLRMGIVGYLATYAIGILQVHGYLA